MSIASLSPERLLPRRMLADQAQRLVEHRRVFLLVQPGRASGWMRQDDDVETLSVARHAVHAADRIFQLRDADQRRGCERAAGDHELRFQQRDLAIEMLAAAR